MSVSADKRERGREVGRPVPLNKALYARVLRMYPGPSTAYRSGHIVQTYKRLGGEETSKNRHPQVVLREVDL